MSIDIDWAALTGGPDGLALAERIRSFVDVKFQQIPLPRFIRSVQVHSFEFGTTAPQIVIKDICDPLPDFYEDGPVDEDDNDGEQEAARDDMTPERSGESLESGRGRPPERSGPLKDSAANGKRPPSYIDTRTLGVRSMFLLPDQLPSPSLGVNTPGIPGGTSNLSYFHLPIAAGLSGTQTPLAAVAGRHLTLEHAIGVPNAVPDFNRHSLANSASSSVRPATAESAQSGVSDISPESQDLGGSHGLNFMQASTAHVEQQTGPEADDESQRAPSLGPEDRAADMQIVSRVTYSGDVKLSVTAEILLDYPMPSFVSIPVRLNIIGMSFDGVGVLAWIRRRVHFCFASPEDASIMVGEGGDSAGRHSGHDGAHSLGRKAEVGGLIQEIRVESEIGQRENGKQSLKNVGKVEKFILEQVRRILEDELVYPSFWTFLI
ncbi:MAG: Mitochondrial distribution and morphology protein 12 [Lichina confinis]|nr:MAG: Mitochondrial distribution and morphology protein 12 [Lichina confinis]